MKSSIAVLAGSLVLIGVARAQGAQAPSGAARTVWDGVYSEAQAARGLTVYKDRCTMCHMEALDGGNVASALVGDDFMGDWKNRTVGDLFRRTEANMPGDDPGSLMPRQVADVLAYVFSKNNFPAGANDLPTDVDALKLIRIQPQK